MRARAFVCIREGGGGGEGRRSPSVGVPCSVNENIAFFSLLVGVRNLIYFRTRLTFFLKQNSINDI